MLDSKSTAKKFNLPAYIQTPLFLYQDIRLEKSAMIIASFFYSLTTAGKSIEASRQYLCQLANIEKSQYYKILNLLESLGYITRKGHTNRSQIFWIYSSNSTIIVTESNTSPVERTSDEKSNTCPLKETKLVHSRRLNLSTQGDTYIKEDIKEDTTTSNSNFFEEYKVLENKNLSLTCEELTKQQKQEKFRIESLTDEKCIAVYKQRFSGLDVTLQELYQSCVDYWNQKEQMVYKARFLTHLQKTPINNYQKISTKKEIKDTRNREFTFEENLLLQDYAYQLKHPDLPAIIKGNKLQQAKELAEFAKNMIIKRPLEHMNQGLEKVSSCLNGFVNNRQALLQEIGKHI